MIVGYVENWNDLAAYAPTIDYGKITHLHVAFENPIDDAGNLSFNTADDTLIQAAQAKGVKVFVSIGGGGLSDDVEGTKRYFWLLSPSKRKEFVAKLTDYVVAHKFDGLDVDLEGPSINGDYGPFVRDLAAALHAKGKGISAALSVGYGGDQVPEMALKAFDFVNVMAYDATGPWAPDRPGQHSSMQLAKDNVAYWRGRGLPSSKIVLGVPFYGHAFGADAKADDWSFAKIVSTYPGAERVDQIGSTVFYNGLPTMRAKGRYIVEQKLGGAMIWSLDQDAKGANSLLGALYDALNGGH